MSISHFAAIGPHTIHYWIDGQGTAGEVERSPLVFINNLLEEMHDV